MSIIIGIDHGYYAIKTAHARSRRADKLRRTRTLHPPRTLRVWRVLFLFVAPGGSLSNGIRLRTTTITC